MPFYADEYTPLTEYFIKLQRANSKRLDFLTFLEQCRDRSAELVPSFVSARLPLSLRPSSALALQGPAPASPSVGAFAYKMLNARKLSDLLTQNVEEQLFPGMFVMSPNGTLLAYSTPANIKALRDQATVVSMAWKEHQGKASQDVQTPGSAESAASGTIPIGALETLTVEFEDKNLIVRAIQPKLLLVLVGGVPPGRKREFKMTPEYCGGPRYPPLEALGSTGTQDSSSDSLPGESPSNLSTLSQKEKDMKLGVLHVQRKKVDVITQFIRDDFDLTGFVMPDDQQFQ